MNEQKVFPGKFQITFRIFFVLDRSLNGLVLYIYNALNLNIMCVHHTFANTIMPYVNFYLRDVKVITRIRSHIVIRNFRVEIGVKEGKV